MSYTSKLTDAKKLFPPKWLSNNLIFEGLTGSVSYGCSDDTSDMDIVGVCIPPKEVIFPHLSGEIMGFGTPVERFEQFQKHQVDMPEWNKSFDITIYSIVKFFQLCMENNPNMVDSLFLPRRCVLHSTQIYELVRENRNLFLHRGSKYKFTGYAHSQMSKIKSKQNASNPKRAETIEKFGYDTKFAYHIVRLLLESEQILNEHTLDLDRNSEILKAVRRGEWTLEHLDKWHSEKELQLEVMYAKSTLRDRPDENAIKTLLMQCIEMHYGKISQVVVKSASVDTLLMELQQVVDKYKD